MIYPFYNMQMIQYFLWIIIFDQARNLKLLLSAFEQLSGLKINFHKSEIFYFGQARDYELQYEQLFGC
jgi:hypothetical protein